MSDAQDPYFRSRRTWDLAWRLLGHAARTRTIVRWTGLSACRIRALMRRHGRRDLDGSMPPRPRGKSPYRIEQLMRSSHKRADAGRFARVCLDIGIGNQEGLPNDIPDVLRGERICEAFEEFRRTYPGSILTIEECMLLEAILCQAGEFGFITCSCCQTLQLVDRLALSRARCPTCRKQATLLPEQSSPAPLPSASQP